MSGRRQTPVAGTATAGAARESGTRSGICPAEGACAKDRSAFGGDGLCAWPASLEGTTASPRVTELETAEVGDLDEHRRAIRVRWTYEKNERYRHLDLPDDLFAAILATLPPREDRDLGAPLFPELTDARLRMAITRACKATGTPHFSPHGLRHRRGSLHYKRTGSLAEVADPLGDSKRIAADHYVYALTDYREVARSIALAPGPRA